MGTSMFEKVIFVDKEDVSKAIELIKEVKCLADNESVDNNVKDGDIMQTEPKKNGSRIIFIIIISMFVIPFFLVILITIFLLLKKIFL